MQIILVVESNRKSASDFKYVNKAIKYFYKRQTNQIKPIFAGGKSNLIKQTKNIELMIKKYKGDSAVIIIADTDIKDTQQNNKLITYCNKYNYKLVWMNKDVEDVFLGKRISNKDKTAEANNYLTKPDSCLDKINLSDDSNKIKEHSSNMLCVFDNYYKRRQR